jgi:uncharacterized OB-fold protein
MTRRTLPSDIAPDELDAPFWDACRRHEFLVHRCRDCSRSYWPATCCIEHGGDDMEWVAASGRGTVHTYTIYRHAFDPAFAANLPYTIAVVRLEEGPFFHTDLVECAPDAVRIGLPVEVVYEDVDGETIPHFRPVP